MTLEEAIQASIQFLQTVANADEPVICDETNLSERADQILDAMATARHVHSADRERRSRSVSNEQLAAGLCYLAIAFGGRRKVARLLEVMARTDNDEFRALLTETARDADQDCAAINKIWPVDRSTA